MEWLADLPWGWMALVGVLVLWGYADAVADSQKVAERVREKRHRERLKAIEKGLPPPDSGFDEALLLYLADGTPGTDAGAARARNRTLGWAIVLVSAGIGWFLTCRHGTYHDAASGRGRRCRSLRLDASVDPVTVIARTRVTSGAALRRGDWLAISLSAS